MGRAGVLLFALLWSSGAVACAGELARVPPADLVRQLGSTSYRERAAAFGELERRGAAVAQVVGEGLRSDDREVCRRCLDLLRQIEDAELRAELRTAHRVRFQFHDRPLASALREIEERTGLRIELPAALARRRVSVDTGDVVFWEAWARFCKAAGLRETQTLDNERQDVGTIPQLALVDGKSTLSADVGSPLRARAVPAVLWGHPALLEIWPAPHLDLIRIDAVRIQRARGQDGRLLTLPVPVAQRQIPDAATLLVDATGRLVSNRCGWLVPLQLPGLQPMEVPRALAGVVTARFLVRRTALRVPALLGSVGKTFAGVRGMTMVVHAANAGSDGRMSLTVQLDHLDGLLMAGPGNHLQRVRPGVVITRDALTALLDGLELHDAMGRALPREAIERLDAAERGVQCRLVFSDVPADSKGLQLVLMARQAVQIDVDFALGGK